MSTIILGIESSCDDTSAAVIKDGYLLSNVVASQAVHEAYGGVVYAWTGIDGVVVGGGIFRQRVCPFIRYSYD